MATQTTSERPKYLADLNPEQQAAAEHLDGPFLVVAGAGTGKTRTLAARVAALIERGADPCTILLLTFTRRAAGEMLRRAGHLVGEAAAKQVWGGTFHAVAHRLLRAHGRQLGLGSRLALLDRGDAEDLMGVVRADLGLHKASVRFPQKGVLLPIYSRCINTGEGLARVLAGRYPWCQEHQEKIKAIFEEYTLRKGKHALMDYDDLLLFLDQALGMPGVGAAIAEHFRHVLVDEYQDTNPIQASILRKLWELMAAVGAPPAEGPVTGARTRSILVVGDDAQAIYSFRGATVRNILDFPKQFPGGRGVTLEQNYRSVTPVLAVANAVMRPARQKFTKNLWSPRSSAQKPLLVTCGTEQEQSCFVANRILELREEGVPLTKQAVLFRAGHNSDALEVELSRRGIPFVKWGGLKFLEAAHVKDLLAFLRVLENPKDELAWQRVFQLLDGVGPGRAREAVKCIREAGTAAEGLARWKAPAVAQAKVGEMVALLRELTGAELPP